MASRMMGEVTRVSIRIIGRGGRKIAAEIRGSDLVLLGSFVLGVAGLNNSLNKGEGVATQVSSKLALCGAAVAGIAVGVLATSIFFYLKNNYTFTRKIKGIEQGSLIIYLKDDEEASEEECKKFLEDFFKSIGILDITWDYNETEYKPSDQMLSVEECEELIAWGKSSSFIVPEKFMGPDKTISPKYWWLVETLFIVKCLILDEEAEWDSFRSQISSAQSAEISKIFSQLKVTPETGETSFAKVSFEKISEYEHKKGVASSSSGTREKQNVAYTIVNNTLEDLKVRLRTNDVDPNRLASVSLQEVASLPTIDVPQSEYKTLEASRVASETLEDIIIVEYKGSKIPFPVSGIPKNQNIHFYPIPEEPKINIAFEETLKLQLFQSAIHGSEDAEKLLCETAEEEKDFKEAKEWLGAHKQEALDHLKEQGISAEQLGLVEKKQLEGVLFAVRMDREVDIRIRHGKEDGLSKDEEEARKKRLETIKQKTGKDKAPVISCVTSGGGFYAAAKEMGLLDQVTYAAALSGSTWSTAKWLAGDVNNPLVRYKDVKHPDVWHADVDHKLLKHDQMDLSQLISIGTHKPTKMDWLTMIYILISKDIMTAYSYLLKAKIGLADIGNTYTSWEEKAKSGKYPIPVCTASFNPNTTKADKFEWIDFTPFEIGSTYLSTYFNIKDFKLTGGQTPPVWMYELAAIWGSAFVAPITMIFETFGHKLPGFIANMLGNATLFNGGQVFNVNHRRTDPVLQTLLPLANTRNIFYCDAASNLPIPPMLRPERGVEILVVFDSTIKENKAPNYRFEQLKRAIPTLVLPADPQHAEFPYVFEVTPDHPTIIYIPGAIKNDEFDPVFDPETNGSTDTINFKYEPDVTSKLAELGYFWTMKAKDQILKAIADYHSK